ncbi:cyclic nucleotide-gated channel-like [Saccoglossus kowalevskii]
MEFEKHLDNTKQYMRTHNVPEEVQRRIQRWYDYTWARGHLTGGGDISNLSLLPDKMKTELALHVNLDTLRKVTIFQECPPEFLHDLVLKMKAFIFTPGDLICRKGEVAREMFIIADGILEVTGEAGEVFTTLKAGDFFGEIGMLNLDKESGANKRTADVRSMGYSELFTLSKEDVLTAIKDFPKAQKILEEFGRKRLQHEKSKISKDHSGDAESRPIIGVTIERAPEDESAFESVTTTVERINSAEIHQWASQQELRTTGTSRNELDAPIVFRQRLGSNDSDHSSTARLIAELYPSPASSDAEKKQSDILKNKLQVRRSSRRSRRGSWKSVSANEDELECQISDITLSMQDVLHKKLMKYHQEIEHLRNNIRDMESQMQLIETENQKKDCRIEELQTLLKEPKQCDCKDGSPGTRDVNTHISATDVQDLLPSVSD